MSDDLSRLRSFDDLTARIWRDKRCTPGGRELLLAVAWVVTRDAGYRDTGVGREHGRYLWQRVSDMLGTDRYRQPRYKQLLADDAPCYRPPRTLDRFCEAPRIRPYRPRSTGNGIVSAACLMKHPHLGECRHTVVPSDAAVAVAPPTLPDEPSMTCDAPAKHEFHVIERDPRTGWHIDHWFCARHRDHFERVRAQVAQAPAAPAPVPNTGGLLPCYFSADWERLYTQVRPHWKPPEYGIAADDWPGVLAGETVARRPRLRLIVGELADA